MTTKTKTPLADAQRIANRFVRLFGPACDRIEIAGSVRRRKESVGDIEIVCIPESQVDLWGYPATFLFEPFIDRLVQDDVIVRGDKNGAKYKTLYLIGDDIKIDLFITAPEQWGANFTIRTGPKEFSRKIVTPRQHGGLMPSHLKFKELRWWDGADPLDTPEERDVFAALGIEWREPWERG